MKSVKVELQTVKLREVGYWQTFFHKNAMLYVGGHGGQDRVQVVMTHGITEDKGEQRLEHLYGDDSAANRKDGGRWLSGDESVQLVIVKWG